MAIKTGSGIFYEILKFAMKIYQKAEARAFFINIFIKKTFFFIKNVIHSVILRLWYIFSTVFIGLSRAIHLEMSFILPMFLVKPSNPQVPCWLLYQKLRTRPTWKLPFAVS